MTRLAHVLLCAPLLACADRETVPEPDEPDRSTERLDDPPAAPERAADDPLAGMLASMGVRIDREARELHVDGWVNMRTGLVEVFACAPDGKTHESVVVLDCIPSGLHAGLLALGLEAGTPVEMGTDGSYVAPTGPGVDILLRWTDATGASFEARAEDWVRNDTTGQSMKPGAWIFAGSFLQPDPEDPRQNTYAADFVKSLATTYHDASSVLENPHSEGIDDTVYYANERTVPDVGTAVTATFRPVD